jgi:hypothetical protein
MTIAAQYATRDMLEAILIDPPPVTFLQKMLVKSEETHDTDKIEIDTERMGQRLSANVSRVGDSEAVGKDGFSTRIHLLPWTSQIQTFTAADLTQRDVGQTVYEGSPSSRADRKVGKSLRKFGNRNVRLREYQLAKALEAGKQSIAGKGFVTYEIDYGRDSSLTGSALTLLDRWGESNADVKGTIQTGQEALVVPGVDGGFATDMVLGVAAGKGFVADDELVAGLDVRRMDNGQINQDLLRDEYATYLGYYKAVGVNVDVWVYAGQYVDSTGTAQYYFNTNGMALINRNMRCQTHYSLISNFHSGNFVGKELPLYWIEQNGKKANVQLDSGFVVATHEPNKCYYRQVGNG